jgi:hypothetical protein
LERAQFQTAKQGPCSTQIPPLSPRS